jgi:hypothetical protein
MPITTAVTPVAQTIRVLGRMAPSETAMSAGTNKNARSGRRVGDEIVAAFERAVAGIEGATLKKPDRNTERIERWRHGRAP